MASRIFTVILDREPTDQELVSMFETHKGIVTFDVKYQLPIAVFASEGDNVTVLINTALRDLRSVGLDPKKIIEGEAGYLANAQSVENYNEGSPEA